MTIALDASWKDTSLQLLVLVPKLENKTPINRDKSSSIREGISIGFQKISFKLEISL